MKAADTPDAWVTMKTKVSLMTTGGVSTQDLNIDTVNGVVTLHGKVATEAAKTKAESVARGIDGFGFFHPWDPSMAPDRPRSKSSSG